MKSMKNAKSDHCESYRQLRRVFSSNLAIFTQNPLVSAEDLEGIEDAQSIPEFVNLAQFVCWLIDDSAESYSEANKYFFNIFPGAFADLPHGASDALLAIRTQLSIKKLLVKPEGSTNAQVLQHALVDGLQEKLCAQHEGSDITDAEKAFVETAKARRASLETDTREKIDETTLREKHQFQAPLQSLSTYIKSRLGANADFASRFGVIIDLPSDPSVDLEAFNDSTATGDMDLDDLSSFFEKTASGLVQDALAGLTEEDAAQAAGSAQSGDKPSGTGGKANGKIDLMTDYKELEALVAESTSNYVKTTLHGLSPVPYQPTVPTSTSKPLKMSIHEFNSNDFTAESMASQLPYLAQLQQHQAQNPYYTYTQPMPEQQQQQQPVSGENLPPNQTFPSAILYDKARQAALSKSSAHTRREGLHSTRRPWTQEEEKALMAGLDMVKGPHWSQILTLFGQNGTISDILKDRTQVQLKDKARNLKLFFLKTNSEMPYYLQAVTGELKTRAPTQAARKEAEERARLNSEEDQAKLQGIMALASGLQHPQNRQGAGVATNVLTPAQAASAAQTKPAVANAANAAQRNLAAAQAQPMPGAQGARPQSQLPPHVPRPQGQQQKPPQAGQQLQYIQQHQNIRPAQPQKPGQGAAGQPQSQAARPAPVGQPVGIAPQQRQSPVTPTQGQQMRPAGSTLQANQAAPAPGQQQPRQIQPQLQQQAQKHLQQQAQQHPQQSNAQQQPQQQQPHAQAHHQPIASSQAQPQQQVQAQQQAPAPEPMSQEAAQEAMNAAEAALLEELKAVS